MRPLEKNLMGFVVLPLTAYLLTFMGFCFYRGHTERQRSCAMPVLRPSNEGGLYQSRSYRVDTRSEPE